MADASKGVAVAGGQPDYFGHVRIEIGDLLPERAEDILEIGCATGLTLKWVKGRFPGARTTGIEGYEPNRAAIEANADRAFIADLDKPLPAELGQFDLILALDVLEHLKDGAGVLKSLVDSHLKPGGAVIVSVPAVSHLSVSVPLLFGRKFPYADAGILDRTHLRLYVEDTSVELMNTAGLTVSNGLLAGLRSRKSKAVNLATGGLLRHWLTKQYIMSGVADGRPQGSVNWRIARYK